MTVDANTRDQLSEALIGVAKVSARGDPKDRDDLAPAILILAELIACISEAAPAQPLSRIEQRAIRVADVENALIALEPRDRAGAGQQRLGIPKTSYYRARRVAEKMCILHTRAPSDSPK